MTDALDITDWIIVWDHAGQSFIGKSITGPERPVDAGDWAHLEPAYQIVLNVPLGRTQGGDVAIGAPLRIVIPRDMMPSEGVVEHVHVTRWRRISEYPRQSRAEFDAAVAQALKIMEEARAAQAGIVRAGAIPKDLKSPLVRG